MSKYEAKDDEPDAKALGKMVAELRKSADYAFSPEVTPEEQAATDANARRAVAWSGAKYGIVPGQTPEPAGAGRSARNSGGDGTLITAEMRRSDPKFMLDKRNAQLILDAASEGRFR